MIIIGHKREGQHNNIASSKTSAGLCGHENAGIKRFSNSPRPPELYNTSTLKIWLPFADIMGLSCSTSIHAKLQYFSFYLFTREPTSLVPRPYELGSGDTQYNSVV